MGPPRNPHDPGEPDLGVLLGLAYGSFVELLHAELRAKGFEDVRGTYGYVFRALAEGPLSISALASRLQITTQGVTKLANEMEEAGYVQRHGDPDDARVKTLTLSERGSRALAAARKFHRNYERKLIEVLGERNVQQLRAALGHIVQSHAGEPAGQRAIRPF